MIVTRGVDYLMAYSYAGRPFELRLGILAAASVRAWWFNPRDGSARSISVVTNSGTTRFTPPGEPGEGHDWVLVLDDAQKAYGPPGEAARSGSR